MVFVLKEAMPVVFVLNNYNRKFLERFQRLKALYNPIKEKHATANTLIQIKSI